MSQHKNKIVVNLLKKEKEKEKEIIKEKENEKGNKDNISININKDKEPKNLFSSFNSNNMVKKNINLNENKKKLTNIIFDEKNINNNESPFDLSFLFLYINKQNIKISFEKYLQKKKIGFNFIKDKNNNNNKNIIHYNCHKNSGIKFNVNLVKLKPENNNKLNNFYICKIKNQSDKKYDFLNFVNTFNSTYCK